MLMHTLHTLENQNWDIAGTSWQATSLYDILVANGQRHQRMHPRADSTEQDWKACRLSPALSSLIRLPPQTVLCTACAHTGWQHYNVHSIVMKSHTLFRFKVIICGLCLKDLSQAARTVLPPEIFGRVYLWNLCYQIRSFFPRKDFLQPFFST